jgi:hypothetical protein
MAEDFRKAQRSSFHEESLTEAVILLTLALGAAASTESSGDFPGHEYFLVAVAILGKSGAFTMALDVVQCKFLVS